MNIDAIAGMMPGLALAPGNSSVEPMLSPITKEPAAQSTGFSTIVSRGLIGLNEQMVNTQMDLQRLAVGDVQNLHQVMIRLEEARLSFQLAMQVRNRVLEAYQDVMKMSV